MGPGAIPCKSGNKKDDGPALLDCCPELSFTKIQVIRCTANPLTVRFPRVLWALEYASKENNAIKVEEGFWRPQWRIIEKEFVGHANNLGIVTFSLAGESVSEVL